MGSQACCNSINNGDLNIIFAQYLQFLVGTSKDQWVAAFDASHTFALAGKRNHQFRYKDLRSGSASAPLANTDYRRIRLNELQNLLVDKIINENDIGCAKRLYSF